MNAPPNTPVFTLQSKDPDTDHNLHYFLVRDRSKIVTLVRIIIKQNSLSAGGRFEVDERSGVVRTRGTEPFQLDMEYVLYVKAEDQNGRDGKRFEMPPFKHLPTSSLGTRAHLRNGFQLWAGSDRLSFTCPAMRPRSLRASERTPTSFL